MRQMKEFLHHLAKNPGWAEVLPSASSNTRPTTEMKVLGLSVREFAIIALHKMRQTE